MTYYNADGTWRQYRGSGKPHGKTERPNVKETYLSPDGTGGVHITGPRYSGPDQLYPWEIPR